MFKKISLLFSLFFIIAPVEAMNHEPLAPKDQTIAARRNDHHNVNEQEQMNQVNQEIELKTKIAAMGIALLVSVVSEHWFSHWLRFRPLVLAATMGIGYLTYKLGENIDHWGLRSVIRRNSQSWLALQQHLNERPNQPNVQNNARSQRVTPQQTGQVSRANNGNEAQIVKTASLAQENADAQEETYQGFIQAIDQRRIDTVRRLVENHGDWVNQRDQEGSLPLYHALSLYEPAAGNKNSGGDQQIARDIVNILLHAGALWNQALQIADDQNHETGLDAAVRMKNIELLRQFFAAGARLHNVSEQYRDYVNALNLVPEDSAAQQQIKQEILHLFARVHVGNNDTDEDSVCPVCLENFDAVSDDGVNRPKNIAVYRCGHLYCQNCFYGMINGNAPCWCGQ